MDKREILEGLKDKPYDFIANHYYELEKEELKDIILELLAQFEGLDYISVKQQLIEGLIEYRDYNEDEDEE